MKLVVRELTGDAAALADATWAAFRRAAGGPALTLFHATSDGVLAGAFAADTGTPRGACGGAATRIGPGTLVALLGVPHEAAAMPCPPDRILNRYARPMMAALSRCGAPAHYFDRDWLSVERRPAASIAFAHDAASRRTLVMTTFGVDVPFWTEEGRRSFLGKAPATLGELAKRPIGTADLARALVATTGDFFGAATSGERPLDDGAGDGGAGEADTLDRERLTPRPGAWSHTAPIPIGELGVTFEGEALRLGGDLMISGDTLTRLERELAILAGDGAAVRERTLAVLGETQAALFGVRSPGELADALASLLGAASTRAAPPAPTRS